MERDIDTHLYDIIQSCLSIQNFTQGLDFQVYASDGLVRSAVERQFIIIGEALNRIKRFDCTVYDRIRYAEQIVGFGNILVHGYDVISDQLVWQVLQSNLIELTEDCQRLLGT
jgi:uncharacterized protein with HEPN domain